MSQARFRLLLNSLSISPDITIMDTGSNSNPGAMNYVTNEIPSGLINGSNAVFTTVNYFMPGSVELWVNGVKQRIIDDFNTSGTNQIQLTFSPAAGEKLMINYIKS